MKKLREVEVPLANFFASGVLALEEKLGPDSMAISTELWLERKTFPGIFSITAKNNERSRASRSPA
jgi:hypothetical protein